MVALEVEVGDFVSVGAFGAVVAVRALGAAVAVGALGAAVAVGAVVGAAVTLPQAAPAIAAVDVASATQDLAVVAKSPPTPKVAHLVASKPALAGRRPSQHEAARRPTRRRRDGGQANAKRSDA